MVDSTTPILIPRSRVSAITGLQRSALYERIARGEFRVATGSKKCPHGVWGSHPRKAKGIRCGPLADAYTVRVPQDKCEHYVSFRAPCACSQLTVAPFIAADPGTD